jgi:N-acetylmuramoyl-L-alanine amidase
MLDVEVEAIHVPSAEGLLYPMEMAGTCQYNSIQFDPYATTLVGNKFAILLGHTQKQQGARNYLGICEHEFNRGIAYRVQELFKKSKINIFIYERSSENIYEGVSALANHMEKNEVLGCMSLHFNSTPDEKIALGSEALVIDSPENSELGIVMVTFLRKVTNIWARGISFIKQGDRGHKELLALKDNNIPSCIFEPCFGNTENLHSKIIFESSEQYVKAISDGIIYFVKNKTGDGPWIL